LWTSLNAITREVLMIRFLTILSILLLFSITIANSDDEDNDMSDKDTYDRVCVVDEAIIYKDSMCQKIAGVVDRWTFAEYLESSDYNSEKVRLESGDEYWVNTDEWYIVYEVLPEDGETTDLLKAYKKYPEKGIEVIKTLKIGELVGGTFGEALLGTIPVKTKSGKSGFVYLRDLKAVGDERFVINLD
jgi:hypothetical protein